MANGESNNEWLFSCLLEAHFKLVRSVLALVPTSLCVTVMHLHNEMAMQKRWRWLQRPGDHLKSNMHWFSPADEVTHEFLLRKF
jgi:hypothetical protein